MVNVGQRWLHWLTLAPLYIYQHHSPPGPVQVPAHVQSLGALRPCMSQSYLVQRTPCQGDLVLPTAQETFSRLKLCQP